MITQTIGNGSRRAHLRGTTRSSAVAMTCLTLLAAQAAIPAFAGPAEQAERIYERIAGVPPSAATLTTMTQEITASPGQSGLLAAAAEATKAPTFYNVVLKNMVTPWTNRNQTVFAPLNDYTATVVGMVRDDVPFNTVLSGDVLYTFNGSGLPAASLSSNSHYATAEANGLDMSSTSVLVATTQSAAYSMPVQATAGVITTYGGGSAFFVAGTNRAMFRFTMINHMCKDMELLMDTTRPTDRIRQDVSRSPGGDSRLFLNNCVGCHTGMDPMAQAFAYYNFDATSGQLVYTSGQVQPKYHINSQNFPQGFVTPDDSWSNRWRQGPNSVMGWSAGLPGSGNGAKTWGQEIAGSQQFAACQVQKVFQTVCFRTPSSTADINAAQTITNNFVSSGYKLKSVFQQVAAACPGT